MFPSAFSYVRPGSVREAVEFLSGHKEDAKILAGGQSLIPMLKLRLAAPEFLVDIGRLPELQRIDLHGDTLEIGACIRHADIEVSELMAAHCPLLAETAAEIGDVQVRNRGTLGGSLSHADPSADFPAAILALDARLKATGPDGQRTILAEGFFTDVMTTALGDNEILTAIEIPKLGPATGCAYVKMHQQASGFAIVGVASLVTLDSEGKVEEIRVGITGVGPVAYRARLVEERLQGKIPGAKEIAEASAFAAEGVEPLSDINASSEYRREMTSVFTRRSLETAVKRAKASRK